MKKRLVITATIGLFLLSILPSITEAAPAGLLECANTLSACTTNLEVCVTGLAQAQTNLANEQTNLATCQATLAECSQKPSLPSWDKKLPCDSKDNCPRFEVLADWGNSAVLDKETGLVWEIRPDPDTATPVEWYTAAGLCSSMEKGGRKGWHSPTIEQLASLVDTSVPGSPKLPVGHPFPTFYEFVWSSSTAYNDSTKGLGVNFMTGNVEAKDKDANSSCFFWCVRGGESYNHQ